MKLLRWLNDQDWKARKSIFCVENILAHSYLLLCPQGSQTFRFSSKDEKWNSLAKSEHTGLLEQTWILAWPHQRNWHFLSKSGMATTLVSYSQFLKLHYFWAAIRAVIFSIFCINLHESRVFVLWLEIMLFTLLIRFSISFGYAHHLLNPFTAVGAHRALIDFTLSNARRFYSSMGNALAAKGLMRISVLFHTVQWKTSVVFLPRRFHGWTIPIWTHPWTAAACMPLCNCYACGDLVWQLHKWHVGSPVSPPSIPLNRTYLGTRPCFLQAWHFQASILVILSSPLC